MSEVFAPDARSIRVPVFVVGGRASYTVRCAIDTGSTQTILPATILRALGYDLARPVHRTRIRSATGIAPAPVIRVSAITALDRVRTDFLVAAHDLPLGVEADGLLGLDFFRGLILTLDFARGRITLALKHWRQFWN